MSVRIDVSIAEAKLGYISGQFRVKLELSRKICLQKDAPDADLFKRAAAKLQSIQAAGQIASFEVYEENVRRVWKKLREDTSFPEFQVITMTLAQGAPKLLGLEFALSTNSKAILDITISANPREIARWYHGWIIYTLNKELQKHGKKESVNASQVKGSMMRAITGQPIVNLPISGIQMDTQTPDQADGDKAYSIVANRTRQEISFMIKDVRAFLKKTDEAAMIKLVTMAATKMKEQTGDEYKVLEEEISSNMKSLAAGPELLGFDLPAVILGAIGVKTIAQTPEIKAEPVRNKDQILDLKVTSNKLIACLANFSMDLYNDQSITFDKAWFKQQMKYLRIPEKMSAPHIESLIQSASRKIDLTGMFVAQGRAAVNSAGPYLHESYLERSSKSVDIENEVLDIRGLQPRALVTQGQLIAEVRFHEEAKAGIDVFGDIIYPSPPKELEIQCGEGVQRRDGGKFLAIYEGVPIIEKNCISLSKILVHKGDVNLRTGNIIFNGPVEIQGSIDTGASIVATGNVSIFGSVRGGRVKSGGSITVAGGVVTGTTGSLEAREMIIADFIENSRLQCGRTLRAKKSILNCDVITGENIEIIDKEEGILAGGNLSCKENIIAANIGFKRGALTILRVGVDWKIERAVRIKTGRLKKVTDCQERDRLELRELVSKSRAQMTKKHDDKKKELQERLTKARVISEKLQQQVETYKVKLSFNMESAVLINGTLCNNVEIHIGGAKVVVPNDLAGVAVIAKKRRGTHIIAVEEILKSVDKNSEAS